MSDTPKPEQPFWDPVSLRRGILIATAIETAFFFLTIALAARQKTAPGTSNATIAVVIEMFVFFPLVLPALLLAWFNRMLILALGLATIAGIVFVTMFFAFEM